LAEIADHQFFFHVLDGQFPVEQGQIVFLGQLDSLTRDAMGFAIAAKLRHRNEVPDSA